MNDNNFDEENEETDDEGLNPVDRMIILADRLCCIGTRDIDIDDAMQALFLLWRSEKNLDNMYGVYFEMTDVDETYQLLKHFNFAEFQKTVMLSQNLFSDVVELRNVVDSMKTAWRMCSFDENKLSGVPHLFEADWNLKLDLRNGDCYKNQQLVKRLLQEDILSIRKDLATTYRFDLPPLNL